MTDYKRKIIRDYTPPSDDEISKYMDFSEVNTAIANTSAAASTGSASVLLTKGIIALSIAGVALLFSIGYYLNNNLPEPEINADLSKAGIEVSLVSSIPTGINHPDVLAFIDFQPAEEDAPQAAKPKQMLVTDENQEAKQPDKLVNTVNQFTDAKPVIGFDSLYAYLRNSLVYPLAPPADTVEGVVVISFVVNKAGEISKPTIITSMGELFDKEATRVISSMPKWTPAKVNETPLSTKKQIAIQFKRKN